jgi:hypothetical protein
LLSALLLAVLAGSAFDQATFQGTPLMDFTPGQLYLDTFPGSLFENDSDSEPADHSAIGISTGAAVQPLDANANPSPTGSIVVVGIGFSNWSSELCTSDFYTAGSQCASGSFIQQSLKNQQVNHTTLQLVDCARISQTGVDWINDVNVTPNSALGSNPVGNYTACLNLLGQLGFTPQQVQVVLYKGADTDPVTSLSAGASCATNPSMDACILEGYIGQMARYLRTPFPNVQQLYLHSRIYGGYATTPLNPEPFAYEGGFATKWAIEAQVLQERSGTIGAVAGDLSYAAAPWMTWGAYLWASGTTPRSDGLTWPQNDFSSADGLHPDAAGASRLPIMMSWSWRDARRTPVNPYPRGRAVAGSR